MRNKLNESSNKNSNLNLENNKLNSENNELNISIKNLNVQINNMNNLLNYQTNKSNNLEQQVKLMKSSHEFYLTFSKLNPFIIEIVNNELKNFNRNKCGLRYSQQIKMIALYLFLTSPKCYRILKQFITLPSKSTLKKQMNNDLIKTGLNSDMLNYLKTIELTGNDRIFNLLLDEVSLKPFLNYDEKEGNFLFFILIKFFFNLIFLI